jgi:dephospho-CoA kinase
MTKVVCLTGGIGSGKTLIANYFKSLGIPVYIADDEAKKLMKRTKIIEDIEAIFGKTVFENNIINREKLASIVFNNPEKLKALNQVIHPAVKKDFEDWLSKHKAFPIVIKEVAILFESGSNSLCDKIITVVAPLETRIQRVLERDKTNRENILARINNQWTDEQRISKSDYIIHNVSVNEVKKEVDEILKLLKNQ